MKAITPVHWALEMKDKALSGEDAWNYHQLADQWVEVIKEEKRKKVLKAQKAVTV
ncbi:hypothetical protein [Aeromonas phage 13AhydR10PP]|nr:hypothetical protein [Aeromonas phage 13AhydR10PP]